MPQSDIRIFVPGVSLHVRQRGNNRCADRSATTATTSRSSSMLQSATRRYGVAVHGYALMTTPHAPARSRPAPSTGPAEAMQAAGDPLRAVLQPQVRPGRHAVDRPLSRPSRSTTNGTGSPVFDTSNRIPSGRRWSCSRSSTDGQAIGRTRWTRPIDWLTTPSAVFEALGADLDRAPSGVPSDLCSAVGHATRSRGSNSSD